MLLVHILLQVYISWDWVETLLNVRKLLIQHIEGILTSQTIQANIVNLESKVKFLWFAIKLSPAQSILTITSCFDASFMFTLTSDWVNFLVSPCIGSLQVNDEMTDYWVLTLNSTWSSLRPLIRYYTLISFPLLVCIEMQYGSRFCNINDRPLTTFIMLVAAITAIICPKLALIFILYY